MPAKERDDPMIRGGADEARRLTPSGDIWTRRSGGARTRQRRSGRRSRRVPTRSPGARGRLGERRSGEGDVDEQRPEQEEECEPPANITLVLTVGRPSAYHR